MEPSQQSLLMPECMSIPIEKYSHSSSSPASTSYQWTHERKRDDLFLVFRNVRMQASGLNSDRECLMMSISAGGNILEQQDVGKLVEMTQKFDLMLQTMALNTANIEAPVQIVAKRPCIAMRYTKDPTKIQRIQVRFKHDQDYNKPLDIFKNLGLPVKDAPQTISIAPASKPSGLNADSQSQGLTFRPSSAASQLWLRPDRIARPFSTSSSVSTIPGSASTPSGESLRGSTESPLYVSQILNRPGTPFPPLELHGEVSQGPKPQLHNSQVPYQQGSLHTSTSSSIDQHKNSPLGISSTFIPTIHGYMQHRKENIHFPNVQNNEAEPKFVPSIYVSQMQGHGRFHKVDGASSAPPCLVTASATNTDLAAALSSQHDTLKLSRTVSSIQPSSSSGVFSNPPVVRNNSLPLHSYQDQSLQRPRSVPIALQSHDEDWIPPRRELPFLKDRTNPKSRLSTIVEPIPESTDVAAVKAPIPSASLTLEAPKKVAKRVAQRNRKNKSDVQDDHELTLPNAPNQASAVPTIGERDSPLASESLIASSKTVLTKRPSSAMDTRLPKAKRPKMIDQSTQTQTLSGRDHMASLHALQGNTVANTHDHPKNPPSAAHPNLMDEIDEFVERNKSRPAPVDPWQTPRYAEASEEGRRAMVNDWICDNLENEDFRKLCEDVEDSWRRIGLGF